MQSILPVLLATVIVSACQCAELPIAGGKSQDGKFEIVMTSESSEPPVCFVREAKTGNSVSELFFGGYAFSLPAAADEFNASSLWNKASTKVALKLRGTKWSTEVTLLNFENGVFVEGKLPNLYPLVFKDIGVSSKYRRSFTSPIRWDNEATLVIKMAGDCDLPGLRPEESRRWFEYEGTIDLTGKRPAIIKRLSFKNHNG